MPVGSGDTPTKTQVSMSSASQASSTASQGQSPGEGSAARTGAAAAAKRAQQPLYRALIAYVRRRLDELDASQNAALTLAERAARKKLGAMGGRGGPRDRARSSHAAAALQGFWVARMAVGRAQFIALRRPDPADASVSADAVWLEVVLDRPDLGADRSCFARTLLTPQSIDDLVRREWSIGLVHQTVMEYLGDRIVDATLAAHATAATGGAARTKPEATVDAADHSATLFLRHVPIAALGIPIPNPITLRVTDPDLSAAVVGWVRSFAAADEGDAFDAAGRDADDEDAAGAAMGSSASATAGSTQSPLTQSDLQRRKDRLSVRVGAPATQHSPGAVSTAASATSASLGGSASASGGVPATSSATQLSATQFSDTVPSQQPLAGEAPSVAVAPPALALRAPVSVTLSASGLPPAKKRKGGRLGI